MLVYNFITYVQTGDGYQTYIHPEIGEFERYKFLNSKEELQDALNKCKAAGWSMVNATSVAIQMNSMASTKAR